MKEGRKFESEMRINEERNIESNEEITRKFIR